MAYSIDLRHRVVDFIESGGSITEASKIFKIGRATIYRWFDREDLAPTKVTHRKRKIDVQELEKDVAENPDTLLKERARKFGVAPSALSYQFGKLKITRKKKQLLYQERDKKQREEYQRKLNELILIYGVTCLVFIDEAGFEEYVSSVDGWSKRGERINGEKQGKRGKKENLVAGRRKKKKDLIAPMLFSGSLNAEGFEGWLEYYLIPALEELSVLIMDNAPIHRKTRIKEIVEGAGHQVLFLPTYSPDLNDIEHDFSALKRARMYAEPGTSIDEIIRNYCAS